MTGSNQTPLFPAPKPFAETPIGGGIFVGSRSAPILSTHFSAGSEKLFANQRK